MVAKKEEEKVKKKVSKKTKEKKKVVETKDDSGSNDEEIVETNDGEGTVSKLSKDDSGLLDAQKKLSKISEIGFVILNDRDVVRHELVKKIINAYDDIL